VEDFGEIRGSLRGLAGIHETHLLLAQLVHALLLAVFQLLCLFVVLKEHGVRLLQLLLLLTELL